MRWKGFIIYFQCGKRDHHDSWRFLVESVCWNWCNYVLFRSDILTDHWRHAMWSLTVRYMCSPTLNLIAEKDMAQSIVHVDIIGRKSHLAHCHQKHYYKKWFTATYLKYLRGRQELQLPRLIVLINRCGHFLLTKAVRKSASQNLLTETITIKMTASVNGIISEGEPLIKVCLD